MRTPLSFSLGSPMVSLSGTAAPGSPPPITTSRYDHQTTSKIGTGLPLYLDHGLAPDKKGTKQMPEEFQDFTAPPDSFFLSTESFIEDDIIKGEVEASTDFSDYISTTELPESSANFDSTDIPITLESHKDILGNHDNFIVLTSASVSNSEGNNANASIITKENKPEDKYLKKETFTENSQSSGEMSDTTRETWEQVNKHPNSDNLEDEGYDWFTTHPAEFQDFTALDSFFLSTESFIEDDVIKEVDGSTDFSDYISTTELTESSTNFDSTDIPVTLENHTDVLRNHDFRVFASGSVNNIGEKNTNASLITKENKPKGKYLNEETFTENTLSSGETSDTTRETWEQINKHHPNNDNLEDEGYDWFMTHPPTPKDDISQESFTADLSKNADKKELTFVLEASPTTELLLDATEIPLSDLSKFDLKIMTTREGLQVDANDASFDPGQVAKATSYEGSFYSTATRSATVTTWVDPEDKQMFGHVVNMTKFKILGNSQDSVNLTSDTELHSSNINLELPTIEDVELKSSIVETDVHPLSDIQTESEIIQSTTATDYKDYGDIKLQEVKPPEITSESNVFDNDVNKNVLEEGNIHTFNGAGYSNDTKVLIKDSKNNTKYSVIYEIPVRGITGNNDPHLDPSVLIALSVCCCFIVLLAVIAIFMWIYHRHRNQSKVYLSQEAAKPRAFLTKPMNPALLPNESIPEPLSMVELQRPRAPILLTDDKEDIYFIDQLPVRKSLQVGSTAGSVVKNGYNNISFCESNIENIHNDKRVIQDPPKYDVNYKCESDRNSGIKVWSSSGSLFITPSQLTHCSVPPPPYSSSVGKESVGLSIHSPNFNNKNEGKLNV